MRGPGPVPPEAPASAAGIGSSTGGPKARLPGDARGRGPTGNHAGGGSDNVRSRVAPVSPLNPVYLTVFYTCLCVDKCKQNLTCKLHTHMHAHAHSHTAKKNQMICRLCSNSSFCRERPVQWVSLQTAGALRSPFHQTQKHQHTGSVPHRVQPRPDAPRIRLGHQRCQGQPGAGLLLSTVNG